jgi:hypothetical protein
VSSDDEDEDIHYYDEETTISGTHQIIFLRRFHQMTSDIPSPKPLQFYSELYTTTNRALNKHVSDPLYRQFQLHYSY